MHAHFSRFHGIVDLPNRVNYDAGQASDNGLGGGVQAGRLAPRVRLRGNASGRAVLPQHLLDKGETDAEHVGNRALGTQSPLPRAENFLTEIECVGSPTIQAIPRLSYDQVQTALEAV
jgi:hypothetical protein